MKIKFCMFVLVLLSLASVSAYTWRYNGTDNMVLDSYGNLTVSGNVTADYFIGDGSLLTNVPAGALGTSINTTEIEDGTITDADINDSTNLTLGQKITFALGEIVDNIVNGWVRIVGGLNVTGNLVVGNNDFFVNESNGRVGINTSAPSSSLEVYGGNITLSNSTSTEINYIKFGRGGYMYDNGTHVVLGHS